MERNDARRTKRSKPDQTSNLPAPRTIWSGPLANNAGGVLVFNLTTDQHVFQAKVWSSTRLRVASGQQQEAEPAPGRDVLRLVVDAKSPDSPKARLYLDSAKSGKQRELTPSSAGLTPLAKRSSAETKIFPPTRTYYLSFDRWNQRIKYGRGYHMEQTIELTWDLDAQSDSVASTQLDDEARAQLFGPGVKLGSMTIIEALGDNGGQLPGDGGGGELHVEDAAAVLEFDPLPLTSNPPPLVLDSSKVQLVDMDTQPRQYMFSADLPGACKVLYSNISGIDTLDDTLAAAIAYSIRTEGAELYKTLWHKKWNSCWTPTDRGKDIANGPGEFPYLRITLGEEYGDGPGIPYVLEIWPGKIGESPIHNHGNVCAVIKVLHGSLKVHLYNKMELKAAADKDPSRTWVEGEHTAHAALKASLPEILPEPLELVKGDVTWMNANWYQTHRLDNSYKPDLGDFCATIQCYKYEDQDTVRWTGFDWFQESAGSNGAIHLFKPDSDYSYTDMKAKVLQEWQHAHGAPH